MSDTRTLEALCEQLITKLEQINELPEQQQKNALRDLEAMADRHITFNEWLQGEAA